MRSPSASDRIAVGGNKTERHRTLKLGFSGTREGMTAAQKDFVRRFVAENCEEIDEVHHGDCIGADDEFDTIVRELAAGYCKIIVHPSNMEKFRAHVDCKPTRSGKPRLKTIMLDERPPILRDCEIVESTEVVIATPKTREPHRYSGTWFTYSYSLRKKRTTYLVYPDGTVPI